MELSTESEHRCAIKVIWEDGVHGVSGGSSVRQKTVSLHPLDWKVLDEFKERTRILVYLFKITQAGSCLAAQWLSLCAQFREHQFNPWSGNCNPTCPAVWPKKKKKYSGRNVEDGLGYGRPVTRLQEVGWEKVNYTEQSAVTVGSSGSMWAEDGTGLI